MTKTLCQSYVHHDTTSFFVSTIDRDSSGTEDRRFAETIVWSFDPKTNARGELLWTGGGTEGNIFTHIGVVNHLFTNGSVEGLE